MHVYINDVTESLLGVIVMHVSRSGLFSGEFVFINFFIFCKAASLQELVVTALIGLGFYEYCIFRM
jgi:hypothetical protein